MTATTSTTATTRGRSADLSEPTSQASTLLRLGFAAAPILFGLDKLTELMADWSIYLWPGFANARLATPCPGASFSGQVGR